MNGHRNLQYEAFHLWMAVLNSNQLVPKLFSGSHIIYKDAGIRRKKD